MESSRQCLRNECDSNQHYGFSADRGEVLSVTEAMRVGNRPPDASCSLAFELQSCPLSGDCPPLQDISCEKKKLAGRFHSPPVTTQFQQDAKPKAKRVLVG